MTEEERVEPTLQPAWATVQAPASTPVHAGEEPKRSQRAWFAQRPIPIYIICAYCTLQWVAITLFIIEKWSTFVELMRTGALAPIPFASGFIYPLILFIAGIFLLFMQKAAILWFALYLLLGLYKVLTQNVSFPGYIDLAHIRNSCLLPPPKSAQATDVMANKSIDTDPKQQEAASPLVLVVRSFLR